MLYNSVVANYVVDRWPVRQLSAQQHIRRIYGFYGAKAKIAYSHFPDEKHDYGLSKRLAAYRFVADHLAMDLKEILDERSEIDEVFVSLRTRTELEVFRGDGDVPPKRTMGNSEVADTFAAHVQSEET